MLLHVFRRKVHMEKYINVIRLYDLNNRLSKKVKKYSLFYGLAILLWSIFFMIFFGITLFTNFIEFIDTYEMQLFYNELIYLFVCVDILMLCLRFGSQTLIEPIHILLYPMSVTLKSSLNIFILLCDWRCIPYIILTGIIALKLIVQMYIIEMFVSMIIMFLLMVNITIWMYLLFYSSGSYFKDHRSNVIIISSLAYLFFSVTLKYNHGMLGNIVPVTSYAGTGLFYLSTGDVLSSLPYLALLVVFLLAGYGVLTLTYERQ